MRISPLSVLAILASLSMNAKASAAEPFRQVLTRASENVHLETWDVSGRKVTPKQPGWSVRKIALRGGKQDGVDLIIVDNGKLKFTVIPTRGLGVLSASLGDVTLGWNSPVKEVVHPRHINLHSRGGLGWLEGFNEWLVRCGLESNGHPGPDRFINNVGDEASMDLTLHGRIANLPASEVELVVDREPPYRIRLRGRVDERMFYGPKLELVTEISTEPGSSEFRIADIITNRGAAEQEFEILYHANYGRPLLEEGATFLVAAAKVVPFNEHAAKSVRQYSSYGGPTPGFVEQVYCIHPRADAQGRVRIALRNKAQTRAVSMTYALKELPYLTLWKNTAPEADGYVTGLEPGSNFPNHRRIERKLGRVPKLAPGASHRATIDYAIHVGPEQVRTVAEQIAAAQGREAPVLEESPEKKD